MLLLSMSDTPVDRKVALAAMAHCALRNVQAKDYFFQVHRMATLNEDTTATAFRVLEQAEFKVFIPQHSLMLGQNYVLIYLLWPTNQDYWLQPAMIVSRPSTTRLRRRAFSSCFGTPRRMPRTKSLQISLPT